VHQLQLTLQEQNKQRGKIKDPSGVKRKDFRGSKAEGGLMEATERLKRQGLRGGGICKKGMNKQAVGKNS